jgi:hypothetical protein
LTALGLGVARVWNRFVASGSVGYLTEVGGEFTTAFHVGVNANMGPARVGLQTGVGWVSFDALDGLTSVRIPVGLVLKTVAQTGGLAISPWIMPRLNLVTAVGVDETATSSEPGISGGVWLTGGGGIGLHVSADVLFRDAGSLWYLGVGIQWNAHALREAFR